MDHDTLDSTEMEHTQKQQFFDKLSVASLNWIELEPGFEYRAIELGSFEFKSVDMLKVDMPPLSCFHCAHARNGGPIGKSNKR